MSAGQEVDRLTGVVPPARTALVTGAGRGIGRHLARGLARDGLGVALLGRRADALREVAEECAAHGVATSVVVADVLDEAAVRTAVQAAEVDLGSIDLLVNNAGVIEPKEVDFLGLDVATSWEVVETNVRGPMHVLHALLPAMITGGGGRVVGLASGASHRAMSVYTGYAVSKGATARLTTLLDAQYRDRGIFAFEVAPGHVDTAMTRSMAMHEGRSDWTPPEATVDLVTAIARGELDALAGRFLRAGSDTVDALVDAASSIVDADARRLDLTSWGADDPLR